MASPCEQVSTGLPACNYQETGAEGVSASRDLAPRARSVLTPITGREGNPTYPTTEIIMAATTR